MKRFMLFALAFGLLGTVVGQAAGPQVTIVTGPEAPKREQHAAQELAGQLKKLYDADVQVTDKLPAKAPLLILLGSPATNPAVKSVAGDKWPKLSEQGHVLRSVPHGDGTALLIGGGSPVATLWAAYEFGYRCGIRYLLSGDYYPAEPRPLKLEGVEVVLEPKLQSRAWCLDLGNGLGASFWGREEHVQLQRQLAKLKFNQLVLQMRPGQPFFQVDAKIRTKGAARLLGAQPIAVDGDTPGRQGFRGQRQLVNADLRSAANETELRRAGIELVRAVLVSARECGLTPSLAVPLLDFAPEHGYSPPLNSAQSRSILKDGKLDPEAQALARAQLQAVLSTYPQVAVLGLDCTTVLGQPSRVPFMVLEPILTDLSLIARSGGSKVSLVVQQEPELLPADKPSGLTRGTCWRDQDVLSPGRLARSLSRFEKQARVASMATALGELSLPLLDDASAVLPQHSLTDIIAIVRSLEGKVGTGYWAQGSMLGDVDLTALALARASFDPRVTAESATDDLVASMCGDEVAPRVRKGFELLEQATARLDATFTRLGTAENPLARHWQGRRLSLEASKDLSGKYAGAMDEMYRGLTRARQGGRPWLLHWAKRLEFALEYLAALDAEQNARGAKEPAQRVEHLEKAVESLYNALTALGESARDSSDRALIALLAEYAYRPLKAELEKAEKAEK